MKKRRLLRNSDASSMRAKLWFSAVSYREGLNAYKLDHKFSQDKNRTGADRIRMFDRPRNGKLPSPGNHYKRSFDLIEVVEANHNYKGTKEIFDSHFWEVCEDRTRHLNMYNFRELTIKCITAAITTYKKPDLKINKNRYFEAEEPYQFKSDKAKSFKIKIPYFLLAQPSLDQLAAISVIYREAYLSCAVAYSESIKEYYIEKIYEFLNEPWIQENLKQEFFYLATKILCPIAQINRNKMDSIKDMIEVPEMDKNSIDFLSAHHVAARREGIKN